MRVMVNERGQRIGEGHPNAKYPDEVVECVLALRNAGYTYGQIVQQLQMPKSTVACICRGDRRGQKGKMDVQAREKRAQDKKVRLQYSVPLWCRTIIAKNGGGEWLKNCVLEAERKRTAEAASLKASARS